MSSSSSSSSSVSVSVSGSVLSSVWLKQIAERTKLAVETYAKQDLIPEAEEKCSAVDDELDDELSVLAIRAMAAAAQEYNKTQDKHHTEHHRGDNHSESAPHSATGSASDSSFSVPLSGFVPDLSSSSVLADLRMLRHQLQLQPQPEHQPHSPTCVSSPHESFPLSGAFRDLFSLGCEFDRRSSVWSDLQDQLTSAIEFTKTEIQEWKAKPINAEAAAAPII